MELNISMDERMKFYNVSGLSIALIGNGQISTAEGFGVLESGTNNRVSNHSIFHACSISKFITSMLVLKLIELGMLDLDEDINNRLTSWKVPTNEFTLDKKVTLRTLLSHQSGIIDPEGSFGEFDSTQGIPTMVELLEGKTAYCKEAIQVQYEPGSDFQYSDAGFCIIQQLIEDASGRPFEVMVTEHIFRPLNMNNSTFVVQYISEVINDDFSCGHNKNGHVVDSKYPIYPFPAAAGLWSTPSDLAILVVELMNSLQGRSNLGLSQSKAKEFITSQGCKEWTGLGVFLDGAEQELKISSLGWGVGFQCMLVAYPYKGTGAVIMTNADLGVHQLQGIIGEIFNSLTL
ncbi:class A beta-lactamase-related serine hydrolase [Paenibacillus anaericanus]|uniref:Class A beta-lactamase-related serine hydrolase n=1 Tax=Paenibacillus anaericanus TaxID=170367 RepID=A0A433Y977_9BACL|nr:serine hydrolase domain-containing protein [Paenibacillus anaericanus]RUT46463.1 class A beta-lactamase-related serine hydrolase [Paenibacillus anaericanus]